MKKNNPVKIVRWSGDIIFNDGVVSNMKAVIGSEEAVKEFAEEMAKINNLEIVVIA